MKRVIKNTSIVVLLLILVLNFLITVGVVTFTVFKPQTAIALLTQLLPQPIPEPFTVKGIGIIGDSQSDEYQADDNRGSTYAGTTRNWVEILSEKRKLNFGTWGEWGETRRIGYEYNWSRTGATTLSMIESGQYIGLAEQVKKGNVNLAIIFIGANDFSPNVAGNGYVEIYEGTLSDALLLRKLHSIIADIKTAAETVEKAGNVKILIVTIPDWGNHIGVQAIFPLPDHRRRVSDAIEFINTDLTAWAKEKGYATADPNTFYSEMLWKSNTLSINGTSLNKVYPSDNPRNVFLSDGIHPGTVYNGLFANYMLSRLDSQLGIHVSQLSEKEIAEVAGL